MYIIHEQGVSVKILIQFEGRDSWTFTQKFSFFPEIKKTFQNFVYKLGLRVGLRGGIFSKIFLRDGIFKSLRAGSRGIFCGVRLRSSMLEKLLKNLTDNFSITFSTCLTAALGPPQANFNHHNFLNNRNYSKSFLLANLTFFVLITTHENPSGLVKIIKSLKLRLPMWILVQI